MQRAGSAQGLLPHRLRHGQQHGCERELFGVDYRHAVVAPRTASVYLGQEVNLSEASVEVFLPPQQLQYTQKRCPRYAISVSWLGLGGHTESPRWSA